MSFTWPLALLALLLVPLVVAATWWRKHAATTTLLPSVVVDTSFVCPNWPQFRFMNDCCSRIPRKVNRLSASLGIGLGPLISRLTSCCRRVPWNCSMSEQ